MSWSVDIIGKPANVVKELDEQSTRLDGASLEEYSAAKPHLQALVSENFANAEGYLEPIVHLRASGSGYSRDGKHLQRSISVSLEPNYTRIV